MRGWAKLPPSWDDWVEHLCCVPTAPPNPHCQLHDGWNDIFTDGSCAFQADSQLQFASWSVVVANKLTDCWDFAVHGILAAAPLPGLVLTAFRAELYALAYALHQGAIQQRSVRIWSDCLGVVNRFTLLTKGVKRLKPTTPNADLWAWVLQSVEHLGLHRIQVCKTEAHKSIQEATTRSMLWRYWNNAAANRAARVANVNRPCEFWELWERVATEFRAARQIHN